MFSIQCDIWKPLFFIKVCRYPNVFFNHHVLVLSETGDLKEVLDLFFTSKITILIAKVTIAKFAELVFLCFTFFFITTSLKVSFFPQDFYVFRSSLYKEQNYSELG